MFKKILLLLMVAILLSSSPVWAANQETKTIIDGAGRKVTLPAKIKKVYSVSPMGTILMYTLAPERIAGRNREISPSEKKYTLKSYQELPVLGATSGRGNTMNMEEIIKAKPDLIISVGQIIPIKISEAEKMQKQLNIPVVLVDLKLDQMDKGYEFMGKLLGVEKRGQELASYCRQTVSQVKAKVATIPSHKRVKVYYAQGNEGLETSPKDSFHTEVLDLVGGINVADVRMQQGGRTQVSMEQIFAWNPETIIVCHDQGYQATGMPYQLIQTDANWRKIQAVQKKRVFQIPYAPFNWLDSPPSVNRIIGVKWLANLLYPNYFKYDLKEETKVFYQKFYHIKITDREVEEILKYAN